MQWLAALFESLMPVLDPLFDILQKLANWMTPQRALGPVVIVLVIGIAATVLSHASLRRAGRAVEYAAAEFDPKSPYASLPPDTTLLGKLAWRYREALGPGHSLPDTQALFAPAVNRIGAGSERLARWTSAVLVGIGLLGTFLGLSDAVAQISDKLSTLTQSDPANFLQQVTPALEAPLAGMGVAFMSSIAGLIGSFMLSALLAFLDLSGQRGSVGDMIEDFLDNRLYPSIHTDPLENVIEQLGHRIENNFDESLSKLGQQMTQMSQRMIDTLAGLNHLVGQLDEAGTLFNDSSHRLLQFGAGLGDTFDQMDRLTEKTTSATENLVAGVASFRGEIAAFNRQEGERLHKLDQLLDHIVESMQSTWTEGLDLIQDTVRSSTTTQQELLARLDRWDEGQRAFSQVMQGLNEAAASLPAQLDDHLDQSLTEARTALETLLEHEQQATEKLVTNVSDHIAEVLIGLNQQFESTLASLTQAVEEIQQGQEAIRGSLDHTRQGSEALVDTTTLLQRTVGNLAETWTEKTTAQFDRAIDNFATKLDLIDKLASAHKEGIHQLQHAYTQDVQSALVLHSVDLPKVTQVMTDVVQSLSTFNDNVDKLVEVATALQQ